MNNFDHFWHKKASWERNIAFQSQHDIHCVKSVRIRGCSGPHSPAFKLNMERYDVSLCIQSEWGKILTRITPNTSTFYAVIYSRYFPCSNVKKDWYIFFCEVPYQIIVIFINKKFTIKLGIQKIQLKGFIYNDSCDPLLHTKIFYTLLWRSQFMKVYWSLKFFLRKLSSSFRLNYQNTDTAINITMTKRV